MWPVALMLLLDISGGGRNSWLMMKGKGWEHGSHNGIGHIVTRVKCLLFVFSWVRHKQVSQGCWVNKAVLWWELWWEVQSENIHSLLLACSVFLPIYIIVHFIWVVVEYRRANYCYCQVDLELFWWNCSFAILLKWLDILFIKTNVWNQNFDILQIHCCNFVTVHLQLSLPIYCSNLKVFL